MSVTELVQSVEVVIDDEGQKKAVLDWPVWEEIVAVLLKRVEEWEAEFTSWDILSDEALLNFETELESDGEG
jgi:hypothetical protein